MTDKLLRDLKTKRAVGGGNMIVHMVMDEAHDEIVRLRASEAAAMERVKVLEAASCSYQAALLEHGIDGSKGLKE